VCAAYRFYDGQPKPCPCRTGRTLLSDPVKSLEHVGECIGWDANARIGYLQYGPSIPHPRGKGDRSPRLRVFYRIIEQIDDHLPETGAVPINKNGTPWLAAKRDLFVLSKKSNLLRCTDCERREIQESRFRESLACIQAGECKQLLDNSGEPLDLL